MTTTTPNNLKLTSDQRADMISDLVFIDAASFGDGQLDEYLDCELADEWQENYEDKIAENSESANQFVTDRIDAAIEKLFDFDGLWHVDYGITEALVPTYKNSVQAKLREVRLKLEELKV